MFAFLSVLDMQDAFNRLGPKRLRGTGAQDENQQGVQARHTQEGLWRQWSVSSSS